MTCSSFLRAAVSLALAAAPAQTPPKTEIEAGFHLLYELKFDQARTQFHAWQNAHPEDPLGYASEAASYLFEEFYQGGVLTSEFFLDDKKLLGGITAKPNEKARTAFMAANQRARDLAQRKRKTNPADPGALFVLSITTGMLADYAGLIEKRHLSSVVLAREAETYAEKLLAVKPDAQDAYLALGAANYIIGCLPAHKRFFLRFGGIHGDKQRGMTQLELAARHGHYLQPFAKTMLALVALRQKQPELARGLLEDLVSEFPENPLYAHELALLKKSAPAVPTSP